MSPNSSTNSLIFSPGTAVRFGGNVFVNVPILLSADGTSLIEVIPNNEISRTTLFTIFHSDGELLAKAIGTCLTLTAAGEKAGLEMHYPTRLTLCTIGDQVLFEVRRNAAANISISAELYSPTGVLIKATGLSPLATFGAKGSPIATSALRDQRFRNFGVGVAVTDEGKTIAVGKK